MVEETRKEIAASRRKDAAALRKHPLFSGIDEFEIDCLVSATETRHFVNGEVLFRCGDPGDSVLLVRSGRVAVESSQASGEKVVMNVLEAGELLGEMAVIEGTTRSATVTALEASEVLVIPQAEFLGLLVNHPGLAVRMLGTVSERLRHLSERIGEEPESS